MADSPLTPKDVYPLVEHPSALLGLCEVVLVDLILHRLEVLLPFLKVFLDFADVGLDRLLQQTTAFRTGHV